jgi:hypothetical protein
LPVGATSPVFAATDHLGAYRIEHLDRSGNGLESGVFVVNLFDEAESDIAPREVIRVGQTEVEAAMREEEGSLEMWPWLAGVALCVFGIEWWVYHRGMLRPYAGGDRT